MEKGTRICADFHRSKKLKKCLVVEQIICVICVYLCPINIRIEQVGNVYVPDIQIIFFSVLLVNSVVNYSLP